MSEIFRRVLITGGAGFIGSHLVERILKEFSPEKIVVVDNFITGRQENLAPWLSDPRLELVEHDLTDMNWLQSWLAEQESDPFSLILHFASPASPPRYQAHPILTYLVNSMTTHYLADFATTTRARMIFASTSEVYGDPEVHPQPENYWGNVNPNGLRSCYDESKRLGETICGVHHREFGADIRLIRIFNTYGPRMDPTDGRVIPNFASQLLKGEPISMYGTGEQTRSFCYVDDLVEGILLYAQRPHLAGETINLGNPVEFSLNELVGVLSELTGKHLEKEFHPLPSDDPQQRQPDISKARRLLGWEPRIDLRTGLQKTLPYFADTQDL